jgi:hypothetical protein
MEVDRQYARKEVIAISICVASVVLGALAIRSHYDLPNTIMAVSFTWNTTSMWVSRVPRFWNKNFKELLVVARQGGLKDSRIASFIRNGGALLLLAWFVAMYRSLKGS